MPGNHNEWSHDRVRSIIRTDEVTPLESGLSAPINDKTSGRFVRGNRGYRRRLLKAKAEGIGTLNPAKAPTWLRPFIELGQSYTIALLAMLKDRPALFALAGDTADAHVMYRALLQLATETEAPKDRAALLSEARGWLREHRTGLATLSALAGDIEIPAADGLNATQRLKKETIESATEEPEPSPEPIITADGTADGAAATADIPETPTE
jgi:hypothetical protein